ncbi:HAD family hydrolase [Pseudalkalibacillus hwajinpoensis]|uniref:HAD family hydrolase n=1 Tax=Guptibacillus hwajinpoensis TaxID=208199 RepID=A0A4U1MPQ5_9BACL|nr:HAD family hydrolase [Pseudalkalibacillus hwajinpoensis]TKD72520.1 HAD family hydrolase [Pseudalkalibacillus hwajinpoensis]
MIKAVLFDLDGTLLNRKASVENFIHDQYKRLLKELEMVDESDYCARFIELDDNGYRWKDEVYKQLVEEYKLAITSEELLDDYLEFFQFHCIPYEGLSDLLFSLKNLNYLMGLISNGRTDFQLRNFQALGIEGHFDSVHISEEEGVKKPDPHIFRQALRRLNVQPDEAVYVGDHHENDIIGAKSAGLKTIWKKDDQVSKGEENASVHSLLDILLVLDEWTTEGKKMHS